MIRRLFVEKRPPFCVEAEQLRNDLNEVFGLSLQSVRILNRYDVENLEDEHYENAKRIIFSEPMVDTVYEEHAPLPEGARVFGLEYLPGQYNQRADSAVQCLQIAAGNGNYKVETAKIFIFTDAFTEDQFAKIKRYLINTVDSREAVLGNKDHMNKEADDSQPVALLTGFMNMQAEALQKLHGQLGLAMSMADLHLVQQYFLQEKRDPTITEIRVLDTYWSDHCRHTTFLTQLTQVKIEQGPYTEPIQKAYADYEQSRSLVYGEKDKDICLMDMAIMGMKRLKQLGKLQDLDESEEINACSIEVDAVINGTVEKWLVMFKNETHNHPTEIEPFGGAATCLGGAIRDPLSGRSYVYQAVRITGSGDPTVPLAHTLPGKLSQKKITTEAAIGFSSYGNQIGLATGHVEEIYDDGFVAKRMEIGAVVGAVPKKNVRRERPSPGDVVILVGGRTGRDGCGGATGSSKEHTDESLQKCGAEVQKGNPVTERKIQRLFRKPEVSLLIKRCNDFGAGGVAVAVGELSAGLAIHLDRLKKKYEGLDGTELAISESQERMAVVVAHADADCFVRLCMDENLEATVIAEVTDNNRLCMFLNQQPIVDISREFLDTNGAKQQAEALIANPTGDYFARDFSGVDVEAKWYEVLSDLNTCSQKGLAERFDSTIGAGSVLMPFGGKHQLTPTEVSVCKLPVITGHTDTATIMAHGYSPTLSRWSPFHGAVYAVTEALAKITACGGDYTKTRLSLQEYFERLQDDPKKWGKPTAGLLGAYYAQMQTGIAAIGGKDSMSGTFKDRTVPPVVTAFGLCVTDAAQTISPELKKTDSVLVFVPLKRDAYGLPDFVCLHKNYGAVHQLIKEGKILAARTVRENGLCEAVSKMAFGNQIGVTLTVTNKNDLFGVHFGGLVLEVAKAFMPEVTEKTDGYAIGETTTDKAITVGTVSMPLAQLIQTWESRLLPVFPIRAAFDSIPADLQKKITKPIMIAKGKFAGPRVFIPVFPGTNCEVDSRRAFEQAGATVTEFVFKNVTRNDILESVQKIKDCINNSQMIMLPGGFSAGDEPEGSAKFINALFRNEEIMQSVNNLLQNRDGLVLGICNGFQALIKLGLVTNGLISPVYADSPTLTFNTIGRHISQMAATRVVSTHSPWLYGVKEGDVHQIPISHGEGRFIANAETLRSLYETGQVATVYEGENSNGSNGAVEGLISPDGRVFGKMGHSERIGENLYKNIQGNSDQKIFESGVHYYQ